MEYIKSVRIGFLTFSVLAIQTANAQWTTNVELSEMMMSVVGHDGSLLSRHAGFTTYQAFDVQYQFDALNRSASYRTAPDSTYLGISLDIQSIAIYDSLDKKYLWHTQVYWGAESWGFLGEVEFETLRGEEEKKKAKAKDKDGKEHEGEISEEIVRRSGHGKFWSQGTFTYKEKNAKGEWEEKQVTVSDTMTENMDCKGDWTFAPEEGAKKPGIKSGLFWNTHDGVGNGVVEIGSVVPEPCAMLAFGGGIAFLAARKRKRRPHVD